MNHRNFVPILLLIVVINYISLAIPTQSASDEDPGYPIIVFENTLLFGKQNRIWHLEENGCWEVALELSDDDALITDFLVIDDVLYISTKFGGLWKYDSETLQSVMNDHLTIGQDKPYYALAPLSDQSMLIGTYGYRVVEEGSLKGLYRWDLIPETQHWEEVIAFPNETTVRSLAIANIDSDQIYAGTRHKGVLKGSIDGGWIRMDEVPRTPTEYNAFFRSDIIVLAIAGDGEQVLYAGSIGPEEASRGFYRYFIEGEGWEQTSNTPVTRNSNVYAIEPDPDQRFPFGVWVGTEDGLFYSSSAGDNWLTLLGGKHRQIEIQGILIHDGVMYALSQKTVYSNTLEDSRSSAGDWTEMVILEQGLICPTLTTITLTPESPVTKEPTIEVPVATEETTPEISPTPDGDGEKIEKCALITLLNDLYEYDPWRFLGTIFLILLFFIAIVYLVIFQKWTSKEYISLFEERLYSSEKFKCIRETYLNTTGSKEPHVAGSYVSDGYPEEYIELEILNENLFVIHEWRTDPINGHAKKIEKTGKWEGKAFTLIASIDDSEVRFRRKKKVRFEYRGQELTADGYFPIRKLSNPYFSYGALYEKNILDA